MSIIYYNSKLTFSESIHDLFNSKTAYSIYCIYRKTRIFTGWFSINRFTWLGWKLMTSGFWISHIYFNLLRKLFSCLIFFVFLLTDDPVRWSPDLLRITSKCKCSIYKLNSHLKVKARFISVPYNIYRRFCQYHNFRECTSYFWFYLQFRENITGRCVILMVNFVLSTRWWY